MVQCDFEFHPPNTSLTAKVESEVQDPNGIPPADVIDPNTPFQIFVRVTLGGTLTNSLAGDLVVKIGVESEGTGTEKDLGPQTKALVPCGTNVYEFIFPVAAGELAAGSRPGTTYIAAINMGVYDPCGNLGPVHGFCRELQFLVSAP